MATWQDFAASYGDTGPIGKLSGVHNSKLFDTMANQIAKAIGYTGKTWVPGTYEFENANEGGTFMDKAQGKTASPEFLKALEAYQFSRDADKLKGTITDTAGQSVGNFTAGNKDTGFDKFAEVAVPLGLAAIAGGAAGLFGPVGGSAAGGAAGSGTITGGGGLTAGGSAGYGSIGGTLGGTGGTTLGVAGSGMSAGAGLTSPLLQSMAAIGTGSVLPASMQTAGGLLDGLPMITADPAAAIEAYVAANPVTAESLVATLPEISMPVVAPSFTQAPEAFNAAKDSQLASSQLGITGAESAAAATAPATVNLGSLGGTMGTAGGLQGMMAEASQGMADAMTAPNAVTGGGGLLGQASSVVNPGLQWLKDNPTLGRLLLGGATGLLSGSGSSGGGSSTVNTGPAKQWTSPLQQGLLSPVQQYAPAAIQQRPAGLLAQGYANDGAWRFLGGK